MIVLETFRKSPGTMIKHQWVHGPTRLARALINEEYSEDQYIILDRLILLGTAEDTRRLVTLLH